MRRGSGTSTVVKKGMGMNTIKASGLMMVAATVLAAAAPDLAHASPFPDASYGNIAQATDVGGYAGEPPLDTQSSHSATAGVGVNGSNGPNEFWTATTENNYSIPSLYVAARATGEVKAVAQSFLGYSVEFGAATSTVDINVKAYGNADVFANGPAGEGFHDFSANGASALLYIMQPDTFSTVFSIVANSDLSSLQGTHSFSLDQTYTFNTGTVYRVFMSAFASADEGHSANAFVDPYFIVPDGVTFLESNGIGNALPNATPIPAALPLFASGLGALGLLGWRRKKKAAALAA